MNLRLFAFFAIIAGVAGGLLEEIFKGAIKSVGKVFHEETSQAGKTVDNAMECLEKISYTVKSTHDVIIRTPEAEEALTVILRALENMKLKADSDKSALINNAMTEVHLALDVVSDYARHMRLASENYFLSPSIIQRRKTQMERQRKADCVANTRPILATLDNSRFKASSSWSDPVNDSFAACQSKVNSGYAWHPGNPSEGHNYYTQYLEARLDGKHTISQIDVYGRGRALGNQFIREFMILYKVDDSSPFVLLCPLGSSECRFDGPPNTDSFVAHKNFVPFTASVVRLEPREFVGAPALRWELFGCQEEDLDEAFTDATGQTKFGY